MNQLIDSTRQTFNKLFENIAKFGSKYDVYRFTAMDTETNALIRKANALGVQTDIFRQGETGIRTLYTSHAAYSRIHGLTDSGSAHMLIGGNKRITKEVESFYKQAGLTVDRVIQDFDKLPENLQRVFAGKSISNRVMRGLARAQKSTSIKLLHTEEELAGALNKALGGTPGSQNVIIGHNVGRFDVMMARGAKGFQGVGVDTAIIDTLELTKRMFPEVAAAKTGAMELDNLISLMTYDKASPTNALIKSAQRELPPTAVDALQFYGLGSIPEEFKQAAALFGGRSGILMAGAHSADVDTTRSMALLHAAMVRAERSTVGTEVFFKYLTEVGALKHLSGRDLISRAKKFDPANVSKYMNVGGYNGKIQSLFDVISAGEVAIDEGAIYSRKGLGSLIGTVKQRYGQTFASSFAKAAKALSDNIDDAVFILRGNSLSFGKLGDAGSFINLPTQIGNFLNIGGKVSSVTNLVSLGKGKTREVSFSSLYYQTMRHIIDAEGHVPTTANAAYSLPNIVKQTLRSKIGGKGRKLQSLIGYSPSVQGLPNIAGTMITEGNLSVIEGESVGLSNAVRRLQDALTDRNKNLVKGDPDSLKRAYTNIDLNISTIVEELKKLGLSEQSAFTKVGNWISKSNKEGLVVNTGNLLTGMSVGESRIKEKGGYRSIGDMLPSQRNAIIKRGGRAIGPSVATGSWLSKRLNEHSIEASVAVFEFDTVKNSRALFEDSASYLIKGAERLIKRKHSAGTVKIKNWSVRDLELLGEYLDPTGGLQLTGKDIRALKENDLIKVSNARSLLDKRKEISRKLFAGKSKRQQRLLESIVKRGSSLASAVFTEDSLSLGFVTSGLHAVSTDSLLVGPLGRLRTTLSGVMGGSLGKTIRGLGADFAISSENFKGMGPMDVLAQHRVSIARREGALDELLGFFNSQRNGFTLADSSVPGVRTLVIPEGVTKQEVLLFSERWKQKLEQQAGDTLSVFNARRASKILSLYDGITADAATIATARNQGATGLNAIRLFYTDVFLRSDATSDINFMNSVRWNAQMIRSYGRGLGASGIDQSKSVVYNYLTKLLKDRTGYTLEGGILSGGILGNLKGMFSGKPPEGSTILKLGSNKEFIDNSGRSYKYLPEAGGSHTITRGQLSGTIFDPTIRKGPMYLDLGERNRFATGTKLDLHTRYLAIPNLRDLGVNVKHEAIIPRDSLAGKMFKALRAYSSENGNLNAKVSLLTGGTKTVKDLFNDSVTSLMGALHGKEGIIKNSSFFDLPNSFSGRLIQKQVIFSKFGTFSPLSANVDSAFQVDLDREQIYEWAKIKLGDKKAKKLIKKMSSGKMMSLLRADPMQKGGHALVLKVGLTRGAGAGNKMDIMVHPFISSRFYRDQDKDTLKLALLDSITNQTGLTEEFTQQVARHATDYNTWLQEIHRMKGTLVGDVLNKTRAEMLTVDKDIISTVSTSLTKEQFAANIGMKMNASVAYTLAKAPRRILDISLLATSPEELLDLLTKSGFDKTNISSDVLSSLSKTLLDISVKEKSGAMELYAAVMQSGIKKGLVKDKLQELTIGIAGLHKNIQGGMPAHEAISISGKMFSEFFSTIASEDLIKPGVVADFLKEKGIALDDYKAMGNIVGNVFGRGLYASAILRQAPRDALNLVTSTSVNMENIAGASLLSNDPSQMVMDTLVDSAISPSPLQTASSMLESPAGKAEVKQGLLQGARDNFDRVKSNILQAMKADGGKIALWGLGILGGYGLYRSITSDPEELPTPPMQMPQNSVPLPPPPMVNTPSDRGIQSYPEIRTRKIARVSRINPSAMPKRSMTRSYSNYSSSNMSANYVNGQVEDNTSTLNNQIIAGRMRAIANSDFVY